MSRCSQKPTEFDLKKVGVRCIKVFLVDAAKVLAKVRFNSAVKLAALAVRRV